MRIPGNARSRVLVGILLADVTCFGVVMPLLASYGAAVGAGEAAIGILVAVYSGMQFALAPLWGRLSDRAGRRPVLLLGLAGTVIASVLFAIADSFLLLLLSRIAAGGVGATLHIAQSYVADQTERAGRTRVMGLIGAAYGVGFIVGPVLGGIASGLGNAAPGIAATAIAAVNLVVAFRWLPEPERRQARSTDERVVPAAARRFAPPFAAAFMSTLAFTVIYVVLPLHAEAALGYGRSRVSYLFALVGLMTAIIQGAVVGRLAPRLGEGRLVMLGGACMALGLASLPTVATDPSRWPLLLGGLAFLGIGFGLAGPAEAGYVSRTAGSEDQGRMLGLLHSVNSVSRITGPVAAGAVMAAGGAPLAFLAAAGSALGAAGMGLVMAGRRTGRSPAGPA